MKTIINWLFLSFVSIAFGQNTIQGTITSTESGNALEYVNIYIPHLEKGTTTDESGNFVINNIPKGSYILVCSFLGFETKSETLIIPNQTHLNIQLTPSAIEMEAVIISTPFHKLQSENVMKVERKTIRELNQSGAVTLAEGLTNIAGVEAVTTGLSISKPVIRGLSSNRVLVYTQGVRLENQQFGSEHGLGLNDAGIESVEVIKGPASLLYGSDALGGVLYINPEKFAQKDSLVADVHANYFTNTQGHNISVGFKESSRNFKLLFRGNITEHSDYKTADYRVTNTRFKNRDFKAGIAYQATKVRTEFRYNMAYSNIGIPEEVTEQSTNKTPLLPFQKVTSHIFSSKTIVFFNASKMAVNLGYIYNDRQEFEDEYDHEIEEPQHEDELHAALHMKLKTFNYDVKYHLPKWGKVETIVGLQGMNQVNTNYGDEELIPNAITNDFGILAVSHIHFNKIDIQLGARFDNRLLQIYNIDDKNFNSLNGAFGIKTNLTENITARLNLATGFRAPNLAELTSDGIHHGTNRYEVGNIDLDNEQNFQTDLALEFKSDHLEFFANGFYNSISNYIYLSPNGMQIDNTPVYNYLQEDAALYGGEFGFHLHPHPLDWLHFESSFETVTGKQENNDYLPLIPANSLSNTIRVEFNTKYITKSYAFIKLKSTFNQNKVSKFETATDGYNLLSAGFGGSLKVFKKELSFSIAGTNLTNKKYINHLSRLKSNDIYNIGRNISIGFIYTL